MQIRIENYIGEIKYFRKKKSLGFKSLLKETQEGKRSHHPRVKKLLDFRLLLGKEKSALQKPTPKTKNCFLSQNRHFLKTRLKHRAKTPPLGYNVSKIRATAKGGGSVRAHARAAVARVGQRPWVGIARRRHARAGPCRPRTSSARVACPNGTCLALRTRTVLCTGALRRCIALPCGATT